MVYNSLEEIQARKEELRRSLGRKDAECRAQWDSLFHGEPEHKAVTPTQRLLSYANTAAGVFDGALLGWKLYKRFKGTGRRR